MIKRGWFLLLTVLLLSVGICLSAHAEEEQDKAITYVTLEFSWDKAPKGGDLVGKVYASSSDRQFVIEGVDYVKRDDTWIFGERPVVEVALSAKSGYYFSDLSRGDFHISGCSAKYKSVDMDSDESYLTLQVYFNKSTEACLPQLLPAGSAPPPPGMKLAAAGDTMSSFTVTMSFWPQSPLRQLRMISLPILIMKESTPSRFSRSVTTAPRPAPGLLGRTIIR